MTEGVEDITAISKVLVRHQNTLAEFLDTVPLTAGNAWNMFDPTSQTPPG